MTAAGESNPIQQAHNGAQQSGLGTAGSKYIAAARDHAIAVLDSRQPGSDGAIYHRLHGITQGNIRFFPLHQPVQGHTVAQIFQRIGARFIHGDLIKNGSQLPDPLHIGLIRSGHEHLITSPNQFPHQIPTEVIDCSVFGGYQKELQLRSTPCIRFLRITRHRRSWFPVPSKLLWDESSTRSISQRGLSPGRGS